MTAISRIQLSSPVMLNAVTISGVFRNQLFHACRFAAAHAHDCSDSVAECMRIDRRFESRGNDPSGLELLNSLAHSRLRKVDYAARAQPS